ncbi:hypothetical protein Tco_1575004, partial [Tanacetum coccineum]
MTMRLQEHCLKRGKSVSPKRPPFRPLQHHPVRRCQQRILVKPSQSPWAKLLIPKIQRDTYNPLSKGSHSPLDEGTRSTKSFPEGKPTDPKDSEGNNQPIDMGLLATHPDEGISTTKPLPEGTNINPKYSERLKPLVDRDSSTPLVTALSRTNAEYQVDQ